MVNERQPKAVSDKVAFVLRKIAENPDTLLRADARRGGLSIEGQQHCTEKLLTSLRSCLEEIKVDPLVGERASQYHEQIKVDMGGGSVSVSLNDGEREEFDSYLEQSQFSPDPFLRKVISTDLVI